MLRPDGAAGGWLGPATNGNLSRPSGPGGIGGKLVKVLAGEYRLVAELGSDGSSTSLLAEQPGPPCRRVLIRVLSPALAGQGACSDRSAGRSRPSR